MEAGKVMEIEGRARMIVMQQLGVNEHAVTPNASFTVDLGADSLDVADLIMVFSDTFSIDISDEDAWEIETFQDAVDCIRASVSAAR